MSADTLLRLTQELHDGELTIAASGSLVNDWPADERTIWTAPEGQIEGLNAELAHSVTELAEELPTGGGDLTEKSKKPLNEYVRSAAGYWRDSDRDTLAQQMRRERLWDLLDGHRARVEKLSRSQPILAARSAATMEVLGPRSHFVPVDLIPLVDYVRPGFDLRASVFALPACFLDVRQIYYSAAGSSIGRMPSSPGLRPGARAFLRSRNAPGWQRMEKYFTAQAPRRTLQAAPTRGVLDDPVAIAAYLIHPWDYAQKAAQVTDVHVYAHGRRGQSRKERFVLDFEYGPAIMPVGFTVRHLELDEATQGFLQSGKLSRSLVWFNCCDAGGRVGADLFSEALALAGTGLAVVAPRGEVPNGAACDLAASFYDAWEYDLSPARAFLAARLSRLAANGDAFSLLFYRLNGDN